MNILQSVLKSRCCFIMMIALIFLLPDISLSREIDMKPHWNDKIPLENPHKGWYHHFPDNHVNKYIIANDSDISEFPGMDHIYMRLAWAYLEPQEGQFNWDIIDKHIEKWIAKGLGIAFRISCRETRCDRIEQQFATPKWVMEAGAKGNFYLNGEQTGPEGAWEPIYDDPVFLEKLENFLKAFGARYDGQPWLRYVDIGSIGDWGEGHTYFGSKSLYNYDQLKIHIDLYLKYFQKSQLVVSDDLVFYHIEDLAEREKLHQYIVDHGISYRDDSILVNGYIGNYSRTYTVRSPEFFEAVYKNKPTVFELEHYGTVKRLGNWLGEAGSSMAQHVPGKTGVDFFRGALELLHATYIGYHGYAHEWIADNPELTIEFLNRCGYWYFLHTVDIPDQLNPGAKTTVTITWENRGVAPAYHAYDLILRLKGPDSITVNIPAGNQNWLPSSGDKIFKEKYQINLPKTLKPGNYDFYLKLFSAESFRTVFLPLNPEIKDDQNFYKIGTVKVSND